jgi:hypothetical protein
MNPAVYGTQAVSPSQPHSRPVPRRLARAFWVISIIVLLIHVLFVLINFRANGELLRDGLARDGAGRENAFELTLHAESLHMQQFAAHIANLPGVHDLFVQAYRAVHAEGGGLGGERSAAIRQQLFDGVAPAWMALSNDYRLRQLHFHLGPGDTSFLRVHSPGRFGDDLSGIRHTITHAIRFNRPTAGFESGRVYAGIRGVVPVTELGPGQDGEVIGAIEAGSSFEHILTLLEDANDASYSVLMTGDHFRATHWPDRAMRVTASNPLIDDWFVEASTDADMVRRLLHGNEVREALGQRRPVIVRVDDTPYAVYSFPFRDYLRTVEPDRPPIGVGITWQDATQALAAADASLRTNLVLGVVGFVVVESAAAHGLGIRPAAPAARDRQAGRRAVPHQYRDAQRDRAPAALGAEADQLPGAPRGHRGRAHPHAERNRRCPAAGGRAATAGRGGPAARAGPGAGDAALDSGRRHHGGHGRAGAVPEPGGRAPDRLVPRRWPPVARSRRCSRHGISSAAGDPLAHRRCLSGECRVPARREHGADATRRRHHAGRAFGVADPRCGRLPPSAWCSCSTTTPRRASWRYSCPTMRRTTP